VSSEHPGDRPGDGAPGQVPDEVDLDLLVDYASGLLDGTAKATEVAARIADHPEWAAALAEVRGANALVLADLTRLATEPEPIPDDVAARLDAALAAEPPLSPIVTPLPIGRKKDEAMSGSDADPDATGDVTPQKTQSAESAPSRDTHGSKQDQSKQDQVESPRFARSRLLLVAATIAGLVGIGGGLGYLFTSLPSERSTDTATSAEASEAQEPGSAEDQDVAGAEPDGREGFPSEAPGDNNAAGDDEGDDAETAPGPAAGGDAPRFTVPVTVSGTDYTESNLAAIREQAPGRHDTVVTDTAPPELTRLASPDALAECLTWMEMFYPYPVELVDYARFSGDAALVVLLQIEQGGYQVVVAGPECGMEGIDEIYTAIL